MIINTAPQNEAVISNVGQIGEFRIRNSAKAFSILSSGLYSNKIRAIVRELSCNAVDSHAAANKKDVPFEVHLPNDLETFFSIRDFGTGLSHDQVTQIYTTYFESTKTSSNEFIGALGLGSKSPFSYTDNFTVTAIKDGSQRIYTAFINEEGVPSIALMTDTVTDEPNGVEVKFSVNDRYDFDKFANEARHVYTHFKTQPIVKGSYGFTFNNVKYSKKDIVPGVHTYADGNRSSVAIMGNIAYPIDPHAFKSSDSRLYDLLGCGLEMEFNIGELDFQASREGLSYIPSTIAAIEAKLKVLQDALTDVLAGEVAEFTNEWRKAKFLVDRAKTALWKQPVYEFVKKTKPHTLEIDSYSGVSFKPFSFKETDLANKYNIEIKAINKYRGERTFKSVKPNSERDTSGPKDQWNNFLLLNVWRFAVGDNVFIINDTKIGALDRVKKHFAKVSIQDYSRTYYILSKFDKTREMDTAAFFKEVESPPEELIVKVSALDKPERSVVSSSVSIVVLQNKTSRYGRYRSREKLGWNAAGDISAFDKKATHYYVPLHGFVMQSKYGYGSATDMFNEIARVPGLFTGSLYGVRKTDIEKVKKLPNWKNFEDHIAEKLQKIDQTELVKQLAFSKLTYIDFIYNFKNSEKLINAKSPILEFFKYVNKTRQATSELESILFLLRKFMPNNTIKADSGLMEKTYSTKLEGLHKRYPLLRGLNPHYVSGNEFANYINLVDKSIDG